LGDLAKGCHSQSGGHRRAVAAPTGRAQSIGCRVTWMVRRRSVADSPRGLGGWVAILAGRAQADGSAGEWFIEPGRARPSKVRPPENQQPSVESPIPTEPATDRQMPDPQRTSNRPSKARPPHNRQPTVESPPNEGRSPFDAQSRQAPPRPGPREASRRGERSAGRAGPTKIPDRDRQSIRDVASAAMGGLDLSART